MACERLAEIQRTLLMNPIWRRKNFSHASCCNVLQSLGSPVIHCVRNAVETLRSSDRIRSFILDIAAALATAVGLFFVIVVAGATLLLIGVWLVLFLWGYVP
jgi:hypothetical protein